MGKILPIPSVPLIIPKNEGDHVWRCAIHTISSKTLECRQEGKFDSVTANFVYFCLAEMVRLKWDSKLRLKCPQGTKTEVQANGEVLYRLLDLCIDLWALTPGNYDHPAFLFAHLFSEWEAWGAIRYLESKPNLTEMRRLIQSENAQLARLENPFTQPITTSFFDLVVEVADRGGRFSTQKYKPFLAARKKMATTISKPGVALVHRTESGEVERSQIRPPKKVALKTRAVQGIQQY